MADEIKCPVCDKVGIPNYHEEDTVCPCCGSDLSIFRVIDQIPQGGKTTKNVWMPISAVAILAAAVFGGILLLQKPQSVGDTGAVAQHIETLQDSIAALNAQLEASSQVQTKTDGAFKYVVKKGDSFWSISKRFYHTGTRYEEVAAANGMTTDSKLTVGDTIIIKQ